MLVSTQGFRPAHVPPVQAVKRYPLAGVAVSVMESLAFAVQELVVQIAVTAGSEIDTLPLLPAATVTVHRATKFAVSVWAAWTLVRVQV
jgi:hypothetical protein